MIKLKRAYEPASRTDGHRVLVERLWPRGVKKEALAVEAWLKDAAPSTALRKWFGHDPERWPEFQERYAEELKAPAARAALAALAALAKKGTLTLVYSAHDEAHNNAVVLQRLLQRRAK